MTNSDFPPPTRDDFEIAIICALPIECNAIEVLLDKEYETGGHPPYGKANGDQNEYITGRLGNQHVVMAYMPDIGSISAAAVAKDLRLSFIGIKVAFVVGICGGVPKFGDEGRTEILLGDVIISTSVIQIDFGRIYPDGFRKKNEVEDILGRASKNIRAFAGRLSGPLALERLHHKTSTYSTRISSKKHFSSSEYPGPKHDILYAAEYRHKHRTSACKTCDECRSRDDNVCNVALKSDCNSLGCQGLPLQHRERLRRAIGGALGGQQVVTAEMQDARNPAIHFGRMASGNQVIKCGLLRNGIAAREKVIGFEMESAGTWDYVPTIVVKGVCDYADSHKDKRWQPYAAATAAACTKAILEEWKNEDRRGQKLPSQPSFPVHQTITQPVNTMFTGREDILCDLKSIIREAVEDTSQQTPCHIVISGMGGQGKSEICLQLARQLSNLFWGVFWIDVSTTTLAENGFLNIANRLGVETSEWTAAKLELINVKQPWLLVLDNGDDRDVDYQQYFPASAFGVVLLTSRNADCERHATKRWVDLQGLSPADARELLFRAARVSEARRETLEADAQVVARLLQSHPLALIQAGSYIGRGHCSFKDYPQAYERQRKRLLEFRPDQARSRYRDVYATFEASAESLQSMKTDESLQSMKTDESLQSMKRDAASDALILLPLLAAYGPNRLPLFLFEAAWNGAQNVLATRAADNDLYRLTFWHRARLPVFLQIEAEMWDNFRLVEALDLLKAFSLVSIDVQESSRNISMHPLVHAWARDRLSPEQQHMFWAQAGCVMALSRHEEDMWLGHARQLQPHVQAITSWPMHKMFSSSSIVEICRILMNCGALLYRMRDDTSLLKLMNSLRTYLNLDPQTTSPQWLHVYELAGRSFLNSGLIRNAVTLLEQVVKIQEQTLAPDHPNRLTSQQGLARAYLTNGQVLDATALLEQVVKIREQKQAPDHPDRLTSQHALAAAYLANGQVRDAIALLEQVVKIREQTLAPDHPHRLDSQHELARAYLANG